MFEKKVNDTEKKAMDKKNKKVKKEKEPNTGKSLAIKSLLIPFVLAAIVVCLIYIVIQNNQKNEIVKTDVVCAKVDIAENELITEDHVDDYFEVVSVDASVVAGNTYKSMKDLPEKFYTEEKIATKQFVYEGTIGAEHAVMDKYVEGTQTTSIAVSAFDNSVAGTLRHGDIVDIYAVDPSSEQLTLMAENIYVVAAYDSAGVELAEDGVAVTFTVLVAPEEKEAVNQAISFKGIQLYLSE